MTNKRSPKGLDAQRTIRAVKADSTRRDEVMKGYQEMYLQLGLMNEDLRRVIEKHDVEDRCHAVRMMCAKLRTWISVRSEDLSAAENAPEFALAVAMARAKEALTSGKGAREALSSLVVAVEENGFEAAERVDGSPPW